MGKTIITNDASRQRVLEGAKLLHDTVAVTLGPKGRNVLIANHNGAPTVTHDGVTVAKSISIDDIDDETLGQSVGVELVKAASIKMDQVGDGTTTSVVLTYHMLKEANRLIAAGYNPMQLRDGMNSAANKIISRLDKYSEDISSDSTKVNQIATISAGGDVEIGNLIAEVMKEIGVDGEVVVEASQSINTEYEINEGYSIGRGFASPYMVTDDKRMEANYKKVPILVTDAKLTSEQQIIPIMDKVAKTGKRDLVIIADEISGNALGFVVLNKIKGAFNTLVIKAPTYGDRRQQTLEDIAAFTGATFVSTEQANALESIEVEDLGLAEQVIATQDKATVIGGGGAQKDIDSRVAQLDALIEQTKNDYDKEFHFKRRASLTGKVAVIHVGGATETEIEEKKFRVDDAVAAAKASIKGGIVPGGAITLINVVTDLTTADENSTPGEPTDGERIVYEAVKQPFTILLQNAGMVPQEWLQKIAATRGMGVDIYNPKSAELTDMKSIGVIDPTDVHRNAVRNAVSIASTAITMGALVIERPVKQADQAQL